VKVFLFIAAALCAYLVTGFNPAIALSCLVYKRDIRKEGSGNPGFTNFRRTFGNRFAWWVLGIDLSKGAAVIALFAYLLSLNGVDFSVGAAFTGLFAVIGHSYPVWYSFKGGKGFLVCLSCAFFVDWRGGLIATAIMLILLFTTKYMSLATIVAMLVVPALLCVFKTEPAATVLYSACVLLMVWRHKENIKRLLCGNETKFKVRTDSKKKK